MNQEAREAFDAIYHTGSVGQLEWEVISLLTAVQDKLKPTVSIELGSCNGGMAYLIASVTEEKVFAVDISHTTNACARHSKVTYITGPTESYFTIREVEDGIGRNRKADFMFIDADHSLDAVTRDYWMWRPLIRSGGWIAFHDINNQGCPGVRKFWNSLAGEKIEFVQNDNHTSFGYAGQVGCGGIGVVKVP